MTDKEIIKALEHHQKHRCFECPLRDNEKSCSATISTLALDLINRQQAEIERLEQENLGLKDGFFQKHYKEKESQELLAVKEALKKARYDYIDLNAEWERLVKVARAEAVKEFADRLKALDRLDVDVSLGYGREHYTEAIAVNLIDNLIKEIVGEE